MTKPYEKEYLIKEIYRFYEENNKYPTFRELKRENGFPSGTAYRRFWGSASELLKELNIIDKENTDGWYIMDENVLKEKYYEGTQEDIIDSLKIKRKWSTICKKATSIGLKRNKDKVYSRKRLPREFLKNELIRFKDEYGRTPLHKDLKNNKSYPSPDAFKKEFGSWNKALIECGLELNMIKEYSREMIISDVIYFFEKNGRIPHYNELKYSQAIIRKFWNNWEELIIESGFDPVQKRKGFKTKEEGVNFLIETTNTLGKVPTVNYLSEELMISKSWFTENFGSYNQALYKAGLVSIEYTYDKNKIIEESLNILKQIHEEKGESPTANEYDIRIKNTPYLNRKALESNLNMRFGEICNTHLGSANQLRKTKEKLLSELVELRDKLGRTPIIKDLKENGLSEFKQYQRTFNKPFSEILEDLGWELSYTKPLYKSKDELLEDYQTLYNKLGRIPLRDDIDKEENICSFSTFIKKLGSLKNIWDTLGLEYKNSIIEHSIGTGITCIDANGEICRSYPEMLITNMFVVNGIEYIKEYYYADLIKGSETKKRLDWYFPKLKICVEYFGMYDEKSKNEIFEKYRNSVHAKIKLCEENNLNLISIYKEDLDNNYEGLLKKFMEHGISLQANKVEYKYTFI